ncbi:MAG: histidine kinase [Bacteroidia bacterium]|jgi:ligand-binding sensor domain-containing protein
MMRMLRKVVLFMLMLPLHVKGQPQTLRFFNYTAEQGLVNNAVHSILKDNDGFLWLGTEGGLSRFDGRTFTNFTSDPLDSNSLGGNLITELYQDRFGLIWIAIEDGGISVFNPETERFKRYVFNPNNLSEPGCNKPTGFVEDTEGNLWVAFWNKGLARFDRKTNSFSIFSFDIRTTGYNFNEILQVTSDAKGLFWLSTRAGLVSFNPKNKRFNTHTSGEISQDLLQGLTVGDDGKIYCGTWGMGLRVFDPVANSWQGFIMDANSKIDGINHCGTLCFIDKNQLLFTNRNKGFGIFDLQKGSFKKLEFEPDNAFSIRSQGAGLTVKKLGSYFALGSKGGFHVNISNHKALEPFYATGAQGDEASGEFVVSSFFPKKQEKKIYVGSYYNKGIYVFDETTKTADLVHPITYGDRKVTSVLASLQNPFDVNQYWWATHSGLLQIMPQNSALPKLEPVKYQKKNLQLIPEKSVYQLFQRHDTVWIVCSKNLYAYALKTDSLVDVFPKLSRSLGEPDLQIINVKPGAHGWLYGITHNRRLFKFQPHLKKADWINLANVSKALPQVINDLTVSKDGTLWLLAGQTGLARFNPENNEVKFYTQKDGLNISRFVSVCTDSQNRVWILSEQGVSVLNPQTGFIRNLGVTHGMSLKDANVIEFKEDGYIYLGGFSKFIRFRPERLLASETDRKIIVTGILVMAKPLKTDKAFRSVRSMELSYEENLLTFSFTIPDAFEQHDFYYFTKLEGLDKDWMPSQRAKVSYAGLPPGKYTLKIRAKDGLGNWCSTEHRIEIIINPPFWKTVWFLSLIFILIAIAVAAGLRWRITTVKRREVEKNRLREQMAELENQALRSQMNPHFIFNCLNSINGFIVGNNPDEASRFVTKFSRLIRLILDNSKEPFVSLEQELAALKIYIDLEKMRFASGFDSHLAISENVNPADIFVPPMIFQPFVENSIWHGLLHKETPGKLRIHVEIDADILIVSIEDDGIGRAAAAELKSKTALKSKSYGLAITRQRIMNFNKGEQCNIPTAVEVEDKFDDQNRAIGTRIMLKLAIRNRT